MKNFILLLSFFCFSNYSFAQNAGEIKGTIKDASSGETIIGATVIISEGKGVITDIDGNYILKIEQGNYTLTVSYVGYETVQQKVKVEGKSLIINFSLHIKT